MVLLADRLDMVYQYIVRLGHVSGGFWAAKFLSGNGSRLPFHCFQAQFVISVAGTVSNLRVTFSDNILGADNYTITFRRQW